MPIKRYPPDINIARQMPAEELSTLLKVSSALAASLDLPTVLQTAIDSAVSVLRLETGAIYTLEGDLLFLGATTPPLKPELEWLRLQPEQLSNHPHIAAAFANGRPVHLPDTTTVQLSPEERIIIEARNLRSMLFIPLLLEGKAIGTLIIGSTSKAREYNQHEVELCRTLAFQITLAVANAKLYRTVILSNEELSRAYDATLEGWSLVLELRDQETQGHTLRVTDLTEELARKIGVPEETLPHVRRGALLHDIGKMGIPDTILKKPGPLTEDEWTIMRLHPEYARQFLAHIDYLIPSLDIPYCHHEKWDGSGYPRGLKGNEIPLPARIFAVVDVFDALTSDRPYRKAWGKKEALNYICEQTGKHFDPQIPPAFLESIS
ncbi:MAG: HD domain-containing protein [Anaerolineaceae bacterium]|nr:HD domain-containing protein [Anaerolineaceae bacterium]